jgi:hypothetical protein
LKKALPLVLGLFVAMAFFAGSRDEAHAEWGWESVGLNSLPLNLLSNAPAHIDLQTCDDGAAATWSKSKLTFSIENSSGIDLATVKSVRAGVLSWNNAGAPYTLTETNSNADISIEIVPVIGLLRLGGANVECSTGASGIQSVEIKIGVSTLTPASIQNIAAHETGHALGLDHARVGQGKVDLMADNISLLAGLTTVVCPSNLDIAALKSESDTSMALNKWSAPRTC